MPRREKATAKTPRTPRQEEKTGMGLATDGHRWSPIQKENKLFNQCSSVPIGGSKLSPVFSSYLGVLGVLAVAFAGVQRRAGCDDIDDRAGEAVRRAASVRITDSRQV